MRNRPQKSSFSHITHHVSEFQPSNHRAGVLQPLFRLVKTEVLRSGPSKSLGLAEVYRLKTQPNRRISRFPRPIPCNLRDEMASWTSFWPPGAQKTLQSEELSAKIEVSQVTYHVSEFQPSNHRTGVLQPLSTRKNRGFALWDLQKSRFGRGLSSQNAAKPKDFTFSPTNTS